MRTRRHARKQGKQLNCHHIYRCPWGIDRLPESQRVLHRRTLLRLLHLLETGETNMFTLATSPLRQVIDIAGADDWEYDPWGTAIGLAFDVASVLDMSDVDGAVTPQPFARWEYRRAPFTVPAIETVAARADDYSEGEWADDHTYGEVSLAAAVRDGHITQADLIYAGDVLNRYTALLVANGRDY
jgi:hypothetical protein